MNDGPNGNLKNRNVAPPKQINRVAAPIQVTPNNNLNNQGMNVNQVNPVNTVNTAMPTSSLAQAAQNQSVRGANVKKQKNVTKEHDPSTMVFITILLIILAGLCAFIFYVILPRIEASKNKIEYNDITTVPPTGVTVVTPFKTSTLNNGNMITTTGNYVVDESFNIVTTDTGNGIDLTINGVKVTTTKKIYPTLGRVDDFIVLILADGEIRSNRVVIYDKNGNTIKEVRNINNAEGMLLLEDPSGYIFSSNNLIMIASRVRDTTIILDDNAGSTEGIDLCDVMTLQDKRIDNNFIVMANYTLSYKGNNEFGDPFKINEVTLQEYRDSNELCR